MAGETYHNFLTAIVSRDALRAEFLSLRNHGFVTKLHSQIRSAPADTLLRTVKQETCGFLLEIMDDKPERLRDYFRLRPQAAVSYLNDYFDAVNEGALAPASFCTRKEACAIQAAFPELSDVLMVRPRALAYRVPRYAFTSAGRN